MELIINTKGKQVICLYDEQDHGLISSHHWFLSHGYVCRNHFNSHGIRTKILLHREILGVEDPHTKCDHIHGDKLDNRRSKLRIATVSQNNMNRISHGKTKYKGVVEWQRKKTHQLKYMVRIAVKGKSKFIGYFKSLTAAAIAYDAAAEKHHGEFAKYNFNKIM